MSKLIPMYDVEAVDIEGISISGTATVEVDFNNLDHSHVELHAFNADAIVQLAKKSDIDFIDLIIAFSKEKHFDVLGQFSDEELFFEIAGRHESDSDPQTGILNKLNQFVSEE